MENTLIGLRVLIVNDHLKQIEDLIAMIKYWGATVHAASSLSGALDIIIDNPHTPFHVVISDFYFDGDSKKSSSRYPKFSAALAACREMHGQVFIGALRTGMDNVPAFPPEQLSILVYAGEMPSEYSMFSAAHCILQGFGASNNFQTNQLVLEACHRYHVSQQREALSDYYPARPDTRIGQDPSAELRVTNAAFLKTPLFYRGKQNGD